MDIYMHIYTKCICAIHTHVHMWVCMYLYVHVYAYAYGDQNPTLGVVHHVISLFL